MEEEDGFHERGEDGLFAKEDDQLLPDDERGTEYEEALARTGRGKFQYLLLAMCGWALSSDAIEVLSISFILVPAQNDLHLSGTDKGLLTAIIFLGMMVGGYLWGSLADIYGRRQVLLMSLTVNGLGGLGSSFSPDVATFIILRFISGIGVGGSMPVIFSYYMEFQTASRRGSMISLLATFWMSGNIICACIAWLIIPQLWSVSVGTINFDSWRIFLAICTIPAFTSGLFFFLMPESPRFLLSVGQDKQALKILKKIFRMNNPRRNVQFDFRVESLLPLTTRSREEEGLLQNQAGCCKRGMNTLKTVVSQTLLLFSKPLRRTSIVLIIIYFTLSYGYYGLFMWFPELFNRMAIHGGSPCSPGNLTVAPSNASGSVTVPERVYVEGLLTALSNLPGNIFTFLVIERIKNGRNILLAVSMVVSGLSVFFIALCNSSSQSVIMSCVFGAISVIGWNCLDVISVELYPTNLRTTAAGFEMGIGRIASILANLTFGLLVNTFCLIPMLLVAGLMTAGGLSAFLLPNKSGQEVDEHPD